MIELNEYFQNKYKDIPETTFESFIFTILKENTPYKQICYRLVDKRPFVLLENEEWLEERKECHILYLQFWDFIKNNISQNELDMINMIREYTGTGKVPYAFDLDKASTINSKLQDSSFILDTIKGPLKYEFSTYDKEEVDKDSMSMAYDDSDQRIVFFVKDPLNITRRELVEILRNKRRLIHEYTHFIDDMNNKLKNDNDLIIDDSPKTYYNLPSEVKAFIQDFMCEFARYIFKHHKEISPEDLLNNFDKYYNEYLSFNNKDFKNKKDTINLFKTAFDYFTDDNKKLLKDYIFKYFEDVYNTENDINLEESNNWKYNQLLKLWRCEKYLKEFGVI